MRSALVSVLSAVALAGCSCATEPGADPDASLGDGGTLDAPAADDAPADAGRCVQANVQTWTLDNYDDVSVRYRARIEPNIATRPWDLYLEFNRYGDTTYTGTFPLGEGHEANFGGCAHCVVAFYGTMVDRGYFAEAGTLTLNRDPFELALDAVLEGVRLVEVTIEGEDLHSVPVPGGGCIELGRVEVSRTFAPPGWTCTPEEYGDGAECDCHCTIPDVDCYDPALPVVGCTAAEVCIERLEGAAVRSACVDDCDRELGVMCPGTQVCTDHPAGDLCVDDPARLDRDAVVGDTCREGAELCGIEGEVGGPGLATAYCDTSDRRDGRCRPRCNVDADCNTAAFERCYTLGSFRDESGTDVFYGFCSPRYPAGWTCGGGEYEDGAVCNCDCGVRDPDCGDATLPVVGCSGDDVCVTRNSCAPGDDTCLPQSVCVPVPANDSCPSAATLSAGTTSGTILGANDDYTHVRDGAGCITFDQDGPDVVYTIALTAGQTLNVVGLAPAFDITLSLHGPGAPTVCDRNSTACIAAAATTFYGESETLTYTATVAGTYYLVVDTFFSEGNGEFTLTTTID